MWPFSQYPERHMSDIAGKAYDYVIVGGGTAGCVVASRLSEDPGVSVLLLEKGPLRDTFLSRIPLLSQNYEASYMAGLLDRFSEPVAACHGRRFHLPSGEGLGGTSRLNSLLLTRGIPAGYNEWADCGLADWGWDRVAPYFRKMESALGHPGKAYRGHDGPLINTQPLLPFAFYPYLRKACTSLGLPAEDDCNSPTASAQGLFKLDVAVDTHGTRMSTYRSYLSQPVAEQRKGHLTICTGVVAAKVQLDESTRKATGVFVASTAMAGKQRRQVFVSAKREVIVCAGAFRSPQLLMLSGIGPKKHLEEVGVPCVHDLPAVGANLADHVSVPIMLELPRQHTLHTLASALHALWHVLLYLLVRKGLFSTATTATTIFARTTALDRETMTVKQGATDDSAQAPDTMDSSRPSNIPDVEIMINPIDCIGRQVSGRSFLTLYTALVQLDAAGSVKLASATDALAHPKIRHPFLASKDDWTTMRNATRLAMRLADEFIFASGYPYPAALTVAPGMDLAVLAKLATMAKTVPSRASGRSQKKTATDTRRLPLKPLPRKSWSPAVVSDADIDAYARCIGNSGLHFTSSCRMSADPRAGVVDSRLFVHGLTNVRIADASVLPKIPSAHTMAPTMMVAERCADFIKETW